LGQEVKGSGTSSLHSLDIEFNLTSKGKPYKLLHFEWAEWSE